MNYVLPRIAPDAPRRIVEKYHCDLLSATIFARRGVTTGHEIRYYLESGLGYLHSPFLFKDMESAVERINAAIEEGEKICIFGDRDADGITSTALLTGELKKMGADVSYRLPEGDSPYGLTSESVQEIASANVTLVITVDCGISCLEEVSKLNELGVDTIITDHHLPSETLPPALAIINPRVKDSGYPFEFLAGCGVASKLIWALRFSQTDFFSSPIILLHAEPGPGEDTTTIVQAVQIENLVETDRVIEELPNGAVDIEHSRLVRLLCRNLPIFVLDKETELRALRKAFGKSADISLADFRSELERVMPRTKGKSLFTLAKESRAVLYEDGHEELEALISLFRSYVIYSQPSLSKEFEAILDYVAIGTVADLMPLVDENRILVRLGLKQMTKAPRSSLVSILSAKDLISHPISAHDIGWVISPVINASGRLGKPSLAVNLLLSEDISECASLSEELLSLNKERQQMSEDAWQKVCPEAKESLESFGSKFLLVKNPDVPRGLTGALASRLLKEFPQTPAAMVLAETEEGRISASIRSHESFPSREFLSNFSAFFTDFGGHTCAGGFSMQKEKLDAFLAELDEVVLKMDIKDEESVTTVDALIPEGYMTPSLADIVTLFEPYGEQNPPLVFMLSGGEITDVTKLGQDRSKGNIKLTVRYGKSSWPCLYWGGESRLDKDFKVGDHIRMIFRLGRNYWKGASFLQLTVIDLERVESDS